MYIVCGFVHVSSVPLKARGDGSSSSEGIVIGGGELISRVPGPYLGGVIEECC